MQALKWIREVAMFFFFGSFVVGGGLGLVWLGGSDLPMVRTLAMLGAFVFCLTATIQMLITAFLWMSGWEIGKVEGAPDAWDEFYYAQMVAAGWHVGQNGWEKNA